MTTRRALLRSAVATVALPFLPSLARAAYVPPRRVVYWFLPNGLVLDEVTPGPDFALPPVLEPLEPLRDRVSVVSGLENRASRQGGNHERCMASLLTDHVLGDPYEGPVVNAESADQVAARAMPAVVPFASLQLGTGEEFVRGRGNLDVYNAHLSWADAATPLAPLNDPKMLFDRMFAGADPEATEAERARRAALRLSVLDAVGDRIGTVRRGLDAADRAKLDQFTTAVREVEDRIAALQALQCEVPTEPVPNLPLGERIAATTDLLVLALRCDYTRVATFAIGPTQALTTYPELGVGKPHHSLSHDWKSRPEDLDQFLAVHRLNFERWGAFLEALREVPDGEGDLLSSTLVAFVTEFSDPNTHDAQPLPMLLAGGEAGGVVQGVHRVVAPQPHSNALRAVLAFQGVDPQGFGEHATGTLDLG